MSKTQCFVIKRGTNFDKDVKEHFELLPKWKNVFERVSVLLGEKITRMVFDPSNLIIVPSELTKEDNIKLFTKDGRLKKNLKKSNKLRESYKVIISSEGLDGFQELSRINFAYGVMRRMGQNLESFRTFENDIYYKADFDLAMSSGGLVIPITEIEYGEKHLEGLKKREEKQ